jgi:hypothetical protein
MRLGNLKPSLSSPSAGTLRYNLEGPRGVRREPGMDLARWTERWRECGARLDSTTVPSSYAPEYCVGRRGRVDRLVCGVVVPELDGMVGNWRGVADVSQGQGGTLAWVRAGQEPRWRAILARLAFGPRAN